MQSKVRPVPPLRLEPREWKRPCRSTSPTSRPGPSWPPSRWRSSSRQAGGLSAGPWHREWRRAQLRRGAVVLAGIEVGLLLILLIRAGTIPGSRLTYATADGIESQPEAPARGVARHPGKPCRAGQWAERGYLRSSALPSLAHFWCCGLFLALARARLARVAPFAFSRYAGRRWPSGRMRARIREPLQNREPGPHPPSRAPSPGVPGEGEEAASPNSPVPGFLDSRTSKLAVRVRVSLDVGVVSQELRKIEKPPQSERLRPRRRPPGVAIVAVAAGLGRLVVPAEVVEQVLPAAVPRLGVLDEPAEPHLVLLVALLVGPGQARHVVEGQVGLEQEVAARQVFPEDCPATGRS